MHPPPLPPSSYVAKQTLAVGAVVCVVLSVVFLTRFSPFNSTTAGATTHIALGIHTGKGKFIGDCPRCPACDTCTSPLSSHSSASSPSPPACVPFKLAHNRTPETFGPTPPPSAPPAIPDASAVLICDGYNETKLISGGGLAGTSCCSHDGRFAGRQLDSGCSGNVTYTDAKLFCSAAGHSICRADQIKKACNTGCNYNSQFQWIANALAPSPTHKPQRIPPMNNKTTSQTNTRYSIVLLLLL